LSEDLFKLSSEVKDINNTIPVLTENLAQITSEVSILSAKVDGGTVNQISSINSDGTSNLEEVASYPSLVELPSRVNTLHSLLTATLLFMGVDVSNQISKDALFYLEVIRNSTHRNSVYEKFLPSVNLDNVDPVDGNLVTNIEQESPFSSLETTVPSTFVNVEFESDGNKSDESDKDKFDNSKKEKR
jgi:hypothetical protein